MIFRFEGCEIFENSFFYSKTLFYGFGFIFCYVSVFPVYFVVAAISVFVDKTMFFISSIVLGS